MAIDKNRGRLPDFLGIGAQKAGTTWLHQVLDRHPDVCMARQRKEVHFFDRYFDKGPDWYRGFFGDCDSRAVSGEITPAYLFDERCSERIHHLMPNVKLMAILRNPIDRAYSQFKFAIREMDYDGWFADFIRDHPDAVERGFYYQQIARYLALFPREQLLILIFEDLIAEPEVEIRNVCRFLGIDENRIADDAHDKANVSQRPRFHRAYVWGKRLTRKLHDHDLSWILNVLKRAGLKRLFFDDRSQPLDFPAMTDADYEALRVYYADDVRRLSELLDRDLDALWNM